MAGRPRLGLTLVAASLSATLAACGFELPAAGQTPSGFAVVTAPVTVAAAVPWVPSWTAAMQPTPLDGTLPAALAEFDDQTIRQTAFLHLGGSRVRVRLSNLYGTKPLLVSQANLARPAGGAAVQPITNRRLTFNGRGSISISPGRVAYSDPVDLAVAACAGLTVSLYVTRGEKAPTTWHAQAGRDSVVSPPGNYAAVASGDAFEQTVPGYVWLDAVEVLPPRPGAAMAVLGDALTDGPDADRRWPDLLACRLNAERGNRVAVVDAGLAGSRLLGGSRHDGPSALQRLPGVLDQPSLRWLFVLEGTGDILDSDGTGPPASAAALVAGYRQVVALAHEQGVRVFAGTLPPAGLDGEREAARQAVNGAIRDGGLFDAYVDFDRVARDPQRPDALRAAYDGGDGRHLNDAGNAALAAAVPRAWFD